MFDSREYYALEAGGSLRLAIAWGLFSRYIVVFLDGQEIGKILRSRLRQPHEIVLTDGSRLKIQLVPSVKILGMELQPYLHITRDGEDLPGMVASPEQQRQLADGSIFTIAVIKFIQAIFAPGKAIPLAEMLHFRGLLEWQKSYVGSIVTGLVLLGLMYLPNRYSRLAYKAALAIIAGDVVFEIFCILVCNNRQGIHLAAIEGLAAVSLYRALRTGDRAASS